MAGQRPTLYSEAQTPATMIINYHSMVPSPAGTTQYIPLFTAAIDLVIEEVTGRFLTNAGTARTGNLCKAASGVDPASSNTDITVTNGINLNGTVNTNFTPSFRSAVSASTAANGSNPPSENIIPRGTTVFLEANAALEADLTGLVLTFRCTAFRH